MISFQTHPVWHKTIPVYKQVTSPLAFSILCISLAFSFYTPQVSAEDGASRLLPEAASIVLDIKTPKLDELKQNVYVGLLAIDAPEGMDYMEIGAQVVLNNFSLFKQAMTTQSAVDEKKYDNPSKHYGNQSKLGSYYDEYGVIYPHPCVRLDATDCIGETLAKKEETLAWVKKESNITLMRRYQKILELPHYQVHLYTIFDPMPMYTYQVQFSHMRLVQALFAFDEGNIDTCFELLGEEMAAAKRVLRENETLVGYMLAIARLYTHYHTISALMDTPQMKPYLQDPRLLALLTPLTVEEQKVFSRSFSVERNWSLYMVYTLDANSFLSEIGKEEILVQLNDLSPALSKAEKQAFLRRLEKPGTVVSDYDRYSTVNMIYKAWEPILQRAGMSMDKIAHLYAQNKLENLQETGKKSYRRQLAIENEARKNNPKIPLNITGRILAEAFPDYELYLQRLYDAQSYILLVNTKHQILSKGLESGEVDAFLKSASKAAQNPITGEQFTWNATEGTLSTAWLSKTQPPGAREDGTRKVMPRNTVYLKLEK